MNGSIQVSNLGKAYKRYPSHRARLLEWLLPSRPRHQQILVKGVAPDWLSLLPVLVLALLLCVLGLRLFRRRAGEMVDEL